MIPNSLMIKFLTVAESGGNAGMDEGERDIAVAVGIEYGWMLDAVTLTDEGRKFTVVGTAEPELVKLPMPPLLQAALDEIGDGKGSGFEAFERRYGIPSRSAKVVLAIALQMGGIVKPKPLVEAPPTKTDESMKVAIEDYRLHAQQGMSIRAIARQRGVEPSTVMRRIQRVKDGMKALAG
jgi:hypothetical protein